MKDRIKILQAELTIELKCVICERTALYWPTVDDPSFSCISCGRIFLAKFSVGPKPLDEISIEDSLIL